MKWLWYVISVGLLLLSLRCVYLDLTEAARWLLTMSWLGLLNAKVSGLEARG